MRGPLSLSHTTTEQLACAQADGHPVVPLALSSALEGRFDTGSALARIAARATSARARARARSPLSSALPRCGPARVCDRAGPARSAHAYKPLVPSSALTRACLWARVCCLA